MTEQTTEEIEESIRTKPGLVAYFSTPDCNVCKVLRPRIEAMTAEREGIDFVYIDSVKHPRISGQNLVFAVPTIALFSEGKEVRRFSRNLALEDLERVLDLMAT